MILSFSRRGSTLWLFVGPIGRVGVRRVRPGILGAIERIFDVDEFRFTRWDFGARG